MDWGSSSHIVHLIATYGLLAIAVIIALESMGLPLPGESVLVLAALYAAHHNQSIVAVVASAGLAFAQSDELDSLLDYLESLRPRAVKFTLDDDTTKTVPLTLITP